MNEEFKDEVRFLANNVVNKEASVVFYGSSSIRLWETLSIDFKELNLINIAFGGSTIEDCIAYYPELLGATQPDLIIFYSGDNDIGNGAEAEVVLGRFINLVELITKDFPSIPIVFISIKPSPERKKHLATIKLSNQMIQDFTENQSNIYFIDVFSKMMLSETEIDTSLFAEDQLHLNEKGYALWKGILKEFLDQEIHQV